MILKRVITIIFFVAVSLFSKAQLIHYVYLQTENGQPFYVKLNNKVTSSSASGYVILPKLSEGDYSIAVGFPKKEFPEENFQISVDNDNKGFLLKNFGEKGWGLFNLQSFAVVMGNSLDNTPVIAKELQDDPFSKMLANVVKDSSLLEKDIVNEVAPVSEKANSDSVIKNIDTIAKNINIETLNGDTAAINNANEKGIVDSPVAINDTTKSVISQDTPPVLSSNITRTLQKKDIDGIEMIYVDKDEISSDTIRIFLPGDKTISLPTETNSETGKVENIDKASDSDTASKEIASSVLQENSDSSKSIVESLPKPANEEEKKDSVASDIGNNDRDSASNNLKPLATINITGDEIKKQDSVQTELPKVVNSSSTNSDCRAFASNEDFIKLRKKMAGENNNDDMIKSAKKFFRSQCFSTEQIKNLSFLFLTDEGKYQFFDAAYAFTADSSQYHILQSQLKDPYYINRFKAMIHK